MKELNAAKVRYLVIGGVAVNLHGYPRITGDLDLMISLDPRNVRSFIAWIKKAKWLPRVPVSIDDLASAAKRKAWIREKGMKVFSVFNPADSNECVDVMVAPAVGFAAAYKRRVVTRAGSVEVAIAGIEDLLRLKKAAGRLRDRVDIMALRRIQRMKDEESKNG